MSETLTTLLLHGYCQNNNFISMLIYTRNKSVNAQQTTTIKTVNSLPCIPAQNPVMAFSIIIVIVNLVSFDLSRIFSQSHHLDYTSSVPFFRRATLKYVPAPICIPPIRTALGYFCGMEKVYQYMCYTNGIKIVYFL